MDNNRPLYINIFEEHKNDIIYANKEYLSRAIVNTLYYSSNT